jgi:D-glycero-D-manno-heptose 1,7-bisphosphate phosphatase
LNKAIFLDRDGTINVDKNYLYKIEDWEFIDGAIEGLQILQELEFKLIVITNQSGIARGYYTEKDAQIIFDFMMDELKKSGVMIDHVYYCPHMDGECDCRKPKLGLFYKSQKDFDINFSKSYAIGDKLRDLSICERENVRGFLLTHESKDLGDKIRACKNLLEAALLIKEEQGIQNGK